MKKKQIVKLCIAVIAVLVIFFPYAKAGFYTLFYGDEFAKEYTQTGMIDGIEYYRVIEYSNSEAKVIYIIEDHKAADMIFFVKNNGKWKLQEWTCLWSKTGSADSFFWPYYR
ncbi:MAG: hypothetical protein IJU78_09480 [Clostridia bacterium]|nr:hypothetical protein [Clostridia bacterium]